MSGTSAGARKGWETRRRKGHSAAASRKAQPKPKPQTRTKPVKVPTWRRYFVDEYERDTVIDMQRQGTRQVLIDRWMQGYELGQRLREG